MAISQYQTNAPIGGGGSCSEQEQRCPVSLERKWCVVNDQTTQPSKQVPPPLHPTIVLFPPPSSPFSCDRSMACLGRGRSYAATTSSRAQARRREESASAAVVAVATNLGRARVAHGLPGRAPHPCHLTIRCRCERLSENAVFWEGGEGRSTAHRQLLSFAMISSSAGSGMYFRVCVFSSRKSEGMIPSPVPTEGEGEDEEEQDFLLLSRCSSYHMCQRNFACDRKHQCD